MTARDVLVQIRLRAARAHAMTASDVGVRTRYTETIELAEALEAVLAIHKPGLVRLDTIGFDFDADEYRTRVVTPCAGCHHEHPCPTVFAIETKLEGR